MYRIWLRLTFTVVFCVSGTALAEEPSCPDILTSVTEVTGINGLEKMSLLHFKGDMASAYDFALKTYGLTIVNERLKWPRLNIKAQQSMGMRQIVGYNPWTKTVLTFAKGLHGHERAAIAHFDGDFNATYDAAVEIYGESVVQDQLGWNRK